MLSRQPVRAANAARLRCAAHLGRCIYPPNYDSAVHRIARKGFHHDRRLSSLFGSLGRRWARCEKGYEDQFPRSRPSGGSVFSEETFARTCGNGSAAPIADPDGLKRGRQQSTPSGHSATGLRSRLLQLLAFPEWGLSDKIEILLRRKAKRYRSSGLPLSPLHLRLATATTGSGKTALGFRSEGRRCPCQKPPEHCGSWVCSVRLPSRMRRRRRLQPHLTVHTGLSPGPRQTRCIRTRPGGRLHARTEDRGRSISRTGRYGIPLPAAISSEEQSGRRQSWRWV
jgi:hypothetical protein